MKLDIVLGASLTTALKTREEDVSGKVTAGGALCLREYLVDAADWESLLESTVVKGCNESRSKCHDALVPNHGQHMQYGKGAAGNTEGWRR